MEEKKTFPVLVIGLMSGTSLDGIDAALIRTDGAHQVEPIDALTIDYPKELRTRLREVITEQQFDVSHVMSLEKEVTLAHAEAVKALLSQASVDAKDVALLGFHGQTITHQPEKQLTWQIGDGALLAKETGIDVVCDFRSRDVAEGGEGAPLVPLYHAAIAANLERPVAVVNIGGIANVTWVGSQPHPEVADTVEMLAFDTGPGNVLLNEWVLAKTGEACDTDGAYAQAGMVNEPVLEAYLSHAYFAMKPPKSLDRQTFEVGLVESLSLEDGAATLTALTVQSIMKAREHFPEPVNQWLICGGGRHNEALMAALKAQSNVPVRVIEAIGYDGDALEAQAFAYLAVRSQKALALSLPQTTGVPHAVSGGAFYPA